MAYYPRTRPVIDHSEENRQDLEDPTDLGGNVDQKLRMGNALPLHLILFYPPASIFRKLLLLMDEKDRAYREFLQRTTKPYIREPRESRAVEIRSPSPKVRSPKIEFCYNNNSNRKRNQSQNTSETTKTFAAVAAAKPSAATAATPSGAAAAPSGAPVAPASKKDNSQARPANKGSHQRENARPSKNNETRHRVEQQQPSKKGNQPKNQEEPNAMNESSTQINNDNNVPRRKLNFSKKKSWNAR